jgi:hypothetical protein
MSTQRAPGNLGLAAFFQDRLDRGYGAVDLFFIALDVHVAEPDDRVDLDVCWFDDE